MKNREGEFYDPLLRFRIAKPQDWQFIPASWSPAAEVRDPDTFDWHRRGALPFVALNRNDASGERLLQSVRVTARPLKGVDVDDTRSRAYLDTQVSALRERMQGDVEIRAASNAETVAGYRANKVVAKLTLHKLKGGFLWPFLLLSHAYSIYAPGMVFIVSMASSSDPLDDRASDFEDILRSISIG
jgi:hypothetical protein